MPELPEVETIRKTLEPMIQNKTIESIEIRYPKIIREPNDTEAFKHLITGQAFQRIERLGKFLLFRLTDYTLVSHLRMEGKYGIYLPDDPKDSHTHIIFSLSDGKELRYKDVRKFGTMHLKEHGTELATAPLNKLGLEPFDEAFTPSYLHENLLKTTRKVKVALLDQSIVTGLGNIYVDEALFLSGIHPERIAQTLTLEECVKLHGMIQKVLSDAIRVGGSSIRTYLNAIGDIGMFQLQISVYGKAGEPCKLCGEEIQKIKVGGRGTHFCASCQPIK